MTRFAVPIMAAALLFGCARPALVVETPLPVIPEPERVDMVTGPLPGVDSVMIQEVVETFDSVFVDAASEQQARQLFLSGQQLVVHAESVLTAAVGPSVLDTTHSGSADTAAFAGAAQRGRTLLAQAARAQAAADSVETRRLLRQAQQQLEEAVSLNPWHEETRYQLAQVYAIRAGHYREQAAWDTTLTLLRNLVAFRADDHGLWAEIALTLQRMERFAESAVLWLRAAETVLDDAGLTFETVAIDSSSVLTYSVRAYRMFVRSRSGEGVRQSLTQVWQYATSQEESDFARRELTWAQWDDHNFEHRLVFDSLRAAAPEAPTEVLTALGALIPRLVRPSARLEASYIHAILSHENGYEDRALDTLQTLWHLVNAPASPRRSVANAADSLDQVPYATYRDDLQRAYATFLFERALDHRQEGRSALAFTYLMQTAATGSEYTGRAYLEALRLARYNPSQALEIVPKVEEIFSMLSLDDQKAYLTEMGTLYRRLGRNDKMTEFRERYRALPSN